MLEGLGFRTGIHGYGFRVQDKAFSDAGMKHPRCVCFSGPLLLEVLLAEVLEFQGL